MRVIAGMFGGRTLVAPKGTTTRPTTDRVREALFSSLTSLAGPGLGDGPVLDAFAGSGALGLEALSRGAGPVTFVESDRAALAALQANISTLGVSASVRVVRGDAFSLARRGIGGPFALILLDPPYTLDAARVRGLLEGLLESGGVAAGALVTWEHASHGAADWPARLIEVSSKRYGSTSIAIARCEEGQGL